MRSPLIERRRALSSVRSGEPGAYERMGSLIGVGMARPPLKAAIVGAACWGAGVAATGAATFVGRGLLAARLRVRAAGADMGLLRRANGGHVMSGRAIKIPRDVRRANAWCALDGIHGAWHHRAPVISRAARSLAGPRTSRFGTLQS